MYSPDRPIIAVLYL